MAALHYATSTDHLAFNLVTLMTITRPQPSLFMAPYLSTTFHCNGIYINVHPTLWWWYPNTTWSSLVWQMLCHSSCRSLADIVFLHSSPSSLVDLLHPSLLIVKKVLSLRANHTYQMTKKANSLFHLLIS